MSPDKVTNYKVISTFHSAHSEPMMMISTIFHQGYNNQAASWLAAETVC